MDSKTMTKAELADELRDDAAHSVGSLRVALDKLDRLLEVVGELATARKRLERMLADPAQTRAAVRETLEEIGLLHQSFQELVIQLRHVPVDQTFRRCQRIVRDLARSLDKRASLELRGVEVEVDATVLERLRDPLAHMVSNALHHGIEPADERLAAGKNPRGKIRLEAWHEAGSIVIELSDDGAGLDRGRILERARHVGILPDGDALTEEEIDGLIFEPGFSTAPQLSRRGVGMDVVRRHIEALRGSVAARSRQGEGTTITLRLPQTLAILHGLTFGVADETFFIPFESVVELVELPEAQREVEGQGVFRLRGKTLRYVRLRHHFGLAETAPQREIVVVVELGGGRVAGLAVDALQGTTQAVIHPLTKLFRHLSGFSGSTVLGNGRVALILDAPALLNQAFPAESADDLPSLSEQAES